MNTKKIDSFVLSVLKESGWFENRIYDATRWIELLVEDGYSLNEYAKDILSELGALSVNKIVDKRLDKTSKYRSSTFTFNAYYGDGQDYLRMPFEKELGENLFPIGSLYDMTAFVSNTNKIYCGDTEELYYFGNGIEEYLNNLFLIEDSVVKIEVHDWLEDIFD